MTKITDDKIESGYSQELLDMLQLGRKVQVLYGDSNRNNEIRHIRAIVDEEYIVYRVWLYSRQDWIYYVRWIYDFQLHFEKGGLSLIEEGI